MSAPRPQAVLFACTFNRIRSPMAEALLHRCCGAEVYVDSVGLDPGEEPDPFAVAVMAELGVDLNIHQMQRWEDLDHGSFDLIVALSPEAHARAQEAARTRAVAVEHWPTPDPSQETGSREQRLEAYRAVRDALARRIDERFGGAG